MFIVVTGLDGSGKTGVMHDIAAELEPNVDTLHLPHDARLREMMELTSSRDIRDDSWTDRLMYILDNRLADRTIRATLASCRHIVAQRGWMDSLIHGELAGYSYEDVAHALRPEELTKPDASIYMVCDPETAWERVKDDAQKDRWEVPEYLRRQYNETVAFYERAGEGVLECFDEPRVLIDTTHQTPKEVTDVATAWLRAQGLL